jgi:hypothetical protein
MTGVSQPVEATLTGIKVLPPDTGALIGSAFDPCEWSVRTINPNKWQGAFYLNYTGTKVHSPYARYTQYNSNNYLQRMWVNRFSGGQGAGTLIDLASPNPLWYASDKPQISPAEYQVVGYSYPNWAANADVGVLISATVYEMGLHLQLNWDDCGTQEGNSGGPDYDFNDKITELFLPLEWQKDYRQVTPEIGKITIKIT